MVQWTRSSFTPAGLAFTAMIFGKESFVIAKSLNFHVMLVLFKLSVLQSNFCGIRRSISHQELCIVGWARSVYQGNFDFSAEWTDLKSSEDFLTLRCHKGYSCYHDKRLSIADIAGLQQPSEDCASLNLFFRFKSLFMKKSAYNFIFSKIKPLFFC